MSENASSTTPTFDPARDYPSLTQDQKHAIHTVINRIDGSFDDTTGDEPDDDALTNLALLGPSEGCVPGDFITDDLADAIIQKFYGFYGAAARLAQQRLAITEFSLESFETVVEPSWEDTSRVVVHDGADLLFHTAEKAWRLEFDTVAELADAVIEQSHIIESSWRRQKQRRAAEAGEESDSA